MPLWATSSVLSKVESIAFSWTRIFILLLRLVLFVLYTSDAARLSFTVRSWFGSSLRLFVGCGRFSVVVAHRTSSLSCVRSVDWWLPWPGILYQDYWRLGWLSAWLRNGGKGWLGLDDMKTVFVVVAKYSSDGKCTWYSHRAGEPSVWAVRKQRVIPRLRDDLWNGGGKSRHLALNLQKEFDVVVRWELL